MAEWSKALDSSSSLSGGVGSNPTWTIFFQIKNVLPELFSNLEKFYDNCCLIFVHDWLAEWSKALVLGTSLSGGKGSNPLSVIIFL